jgi:hypothetical protein
MYYVTDAKFFSVFQGTTLKNLVIKLLDSDQWSIFNTCGGIAMATMGKYCKAYLLSDLRGYPGWTEKVENIRQEKMDQDRQQSAERRTLSHEDYLFLQENYTVTDGIFIDENVIFDQVTPEWIDYCANALKFEIPDLGSADEASSTVAG